MSEKEESKDLREYEDVCTICKDVVVTRNCVNSGYCITCKKCFCQRHLNLVRAGTEISKILYCDECGYPNYSSALACNVL